MRRAISTLQNRREQADHAGLLLQRYLAEQNSPEERHALLEATIKAARSDSLCMIYADAFRRWTNFFPQDKTQAADLATTSRLVVGLGSENVLETGLRLHHTYGVPIIPGSALKGLASHYCHDIWGQRNNDEAPAENLPFRRGGTHHTLLFGATDDSGAITFHDAWITPTSLEEGALRLDVMTPHHPNWQTNEALPTDFDSPRPVSYLSVAGTFAVQLSWSGPTAVPLDQAEAWATLAMTLLKEVLAEWGVGGKTSSGYGRLLPREALEHHHQPRNASQQSRIVLPNAGVKVEAILLEERTKKGGWKAKHEPSGLNGPIQNHGDVPADRKVGDVLSLIVASANKREIAFRYPTTADEARTQRASSKNTGIRGGSNRNR